MAKPTPQNPVDLAEVILVGEAQEADPLQSRGLWKRRVEAHSGVVLAPIGERRVTTIRKDRLELDVGVVDIEAEHVSVDVW